MLKTVFVGLSGGVDSAVSAALFKQATPNNFEKLFGRPTPEGFRGFNVVGVFIKIWQPEFIECTWAADRLDAMRVCVALEIPFREADLSDDYRRMVVEDMISTYSRGVTPNPDVLCNRHIKFGSFMKYAMREGADYIATGHYTRIQKIKMQKSKIKMSMQKSKMEHGEEYELLRGIDKEKDQSYFLYLLNQDDLARTLFPIGNLKKSEVRKLARRFALPNADKPDSQGLCFVGDVTMKDFLSRYIKLHAGKVMDTNGNLIGSHDGAALYTIGQRHGYTTERLSGDKIPYYVVSVDISANTICVSTRREDAARKEARVSSMHWISDSPTMPFSAQTQARYREKPSDATISQEGSGVKITFNEPQIAAPGQSLVIYNGDVCLGGGVIA